MPILPTSCRKAPSEQSLHEYIFGTLDVLRADCTGHVAAPQGDGLGIRVDWEAVRDAAFSCYEVRF